MRSPSVAFTQAWAPSLRRRTSGSIDETGVTCGAAARVMDRDLQGEARARHLRRAPPGRHRLPGRTVTCSYVAVRQSALRGRGTPGSGRWPARLFSWPCACPLRMAVASSRLSHLRGIHDIECSEG